MPAILKNSIKYTGSGGGEITTADSVICTDTESLQYKLDTSLVTKKTTGELADLDTEDKSNIVSALNEVKAGAVTEEITGELVNLVTTDASNLVAAINEVKKGNSEFVKGKGIELSVVDGILQITYDNGVS